MKKAIIIIITMALAHSARADYHYASHEGSNEYPYTSWATAAWLVQDALDASEMYDTVYIGAGQYYEQIEMQPEDSCVTIIGAGMDSVLIWTDVNDILFRRSQRTSFIDLGFEHLGTTAAKILERRYITGPNTHLYVNRCKFMGGAHVIGIMGLSDGTEIIENSVFEGLSPYDQHRVCSLSVFRNNLCNLSHGAPPALIISGYEIIVENNIFNVIGSSDGTAIFNGGYIDTLLIKNNLFYNFVQGAFALRNTSPGSQFSFNICERFNPGHFGVGLTFQVYEVDSLNHFDVIGNSFRDIETGIRIIDSAPEVMPIVSLNYNNFWNVENIVEYEYPGYFDSVGNIMCDPMYMGGEDYHLQAFSPLIDAGDPGILDLDSTRSDIGLYGGPLGEIYIYQDLPPQSPDSLYAYVEGDSILIGWRFNTEADFGNYRLYRDTISGFEPSIFNLLAEPDTSFYIDMDFENGHNYYYRISAVDNQQNISDYSEELAVILTDARDIFGPDVPVLTSIVGNYPNPFNNRTIIRYNVGNIGPMPVDIRIEIYDLLGKIVKKIIDKNRYPGEHTVTWDGRDNFGNELSSGVYFVKIIQWEALIESKPKKMMLLK